MRPESMRLSGIKSQRVAAISECVQGPLAAVGRAATRLDLRPRHINRPKLRLRKGVDCDARLK